MNSYIKHLTNLKAILEKAKVWQEAQKISDETLLGARIALDQFSFASQVRSTTNAARQSASALYNAEYLSIDDTEKTLADLQARIDTSIAYISNCKQKPIAEDLDTRIVPLAWMPGKGIVARFFVEEYTHANFYFHYTTAYSILRHYGLNIGKSDYMGTIELRDTN